MRSTLHGLRRKVAIAGVAVPGAGPALGAGVPGQAAAGCTVVHQPHRRWPGLFTGDVTNAGAPVADQTPVLVSPGQSATVKPALGAAPTADVRSAAPAGTPTFHEPSYVDAPMYRDPPPNQWFGFQAWSLERLADYYYYATGDAKATSIRDNWVAWALASTTISATDYRIPSTPTWSGAPVTWNPSSPAATTNRHVSIVDYTNDVGVAGSYAKMLAYYAAKSGSTAATSAAKTLLDGIRAHEDSKGVSVTETREDYKRFDDTYDASTGQGIDIPPGSTGAMPEDDLIKPGVSFLDIRSFYRKDPDFPKVQAYLTGGPAPTFNYHRFWAQVDVATGYADYARLFPNG